MVRATNRPGHCLIGSPLYEAMVFGQVSDLGNRRPGVQISPSLPTRTTGQERVSLLPSDPSHAQGGAVEDVPVSTRR